MQQVIYQLVRNVDQMDSDDETVRSVRASTIEKISSCLVCDNSQDTLFCFVLVRR